MNLVIDIGNTKTTFGFFHENNLITCFNLNSNLNLTFSQWKQLFIEKFENENLNHSISKVAISSVVPELNKIICDLMMKLFNVESIVLDFKSFDELDFDLSSPSKVGIDRIINCNYILKKYNKGAIVVDLGSAITWDVISPEGVFSGGVIAPGIGLSFKALHENTSKLPMIDFKNFGSFASTLGKTTEECLKSAAVHGYSSMVDGVVLKLKSELDFEPLVISTGGWADFLSPHLKTIDKNINHLTLKGINLMI
jgi:type III pantothenate kinase